MQSTINEQVDELLAQDLIKPSHSAYSSPVVKVERKNKQWCLCIERYAYPVPRMDYIINQLRKARYICRYTGPEQRILANTYERKQQTLYGLYSPRTRIVSVEGNAVRATHSAGHFS